MTHTHTSRRWSMGTVALAASATALGVGLAVSNPSTATSLAGTAGVGAVPVQNVAGGSAPTGLTLAKNRQTITSALRVDLTRDFARLPLHRGKADGETVWYVITDTSNARMARRLGVNHSPKLRNAQRDCPACVQEVKTNRPLLGKATDGPPLTERLVPLRTILIPPVNL